MEEKKNEIVKTETEGEIMPSVESLILNIRGQQVMLDRDLARLYGVETKSLNQAVKRNIERFPERYRFQLNKVETKELVTNCDRFNSLKHSSIAPNAFTEQGVAMLASVLKSDTAVRVSIRIIDAFVAMRRFLSTNAQLFSRIETLEHQQLSMLNRQDETERKIDRIFQELEDKNPKPTQGIFYDGQIFDAYTFVCGLIKEAKKTIVLIDNYIDETVLTLLDKRKQSVGATIYTKTMSRQIRLDLDRHNAQYPPISVAIASNFHDRFLVIDETVYHIGASLKDLGKKVFGFTKMVLLTPEELLSKIKI